MQPPYSYRDDQKIPCFPDDKPVIVFDGHCVLCSGWVNFMIRHDKHKTYRLLAAQSVTGDALYQHYGLGGADYQTNLLIQNGRLFIKSDAIIRMFCGLGWPWRALGLLRVLPTSLCDFFYDLIARHRLRWFGRREVCYFPSAADKDRFIF